MNLSSECTLVAPSPAVLHPTSENNPRSPRDARSPLGQSKVQNISYTPKEKAKGQDSPLRRKLSPVHRTPQRVQVTQSPTSPSSPMSADSSPLRNNALEFSLQKQCAELYAKLTSLSTEYKHLEEDLLKKDAQVDDLSKKMLASERMLRKLETESRNEIELSKQELFFYKSTIEELRRQNTRITEKLESAHILAECRVSESEDKYSKLFKSYKALQSNFELEQNSKALLIDQIEYLTKERDFLLSNSKASSSENLEKESFSTDSSNLQYSKLQSLHGQNSDVESDSDGSVNGSCLSAPFQTLAEMHQFDSSSPIKDDSQHLFHLASEYQFPPPQATGEMPSELEKGVCVSPEKADAKAKFAKRRSLPASLRSNSSFQEDDFVLSPLKLTRHSNLSHIDADSLLMAGQQDKPESSKKRYSSSKPNHSRYNSHDIVPIKVEFELLNQQLRSPSVPDKDYLQQLASVAESNIIEDPCEMAFMKLNGYSDQKKRDSILTSSSKRSSILTDANLSNSDITKQEITKLKFELQSLKLHNEKLLSYIGFELQKQKKNIKKLSSKQNLRPKNPSNNIEYSDAKLIEKSRDMLIHKKRVLRSVSINPVLYSAFDSKKNSAIFPTEFGIGHSAEEEDEFMFKSHFISSIRPNVCKGRVNKPEDRSISAGFQQKDSDSAQTIKKFKSQTFGSHRTNYISGSLSEDDSYISDEDFGESNEAFEDDIDEYDCATIGSASEGWETLSDRSSASEIDYDELNRFNRMRYLILGKESLKKKKKNTEAIADENMKYKFLTIVIGIAIIGFRFTTHPHTQLNGAS